MTEFKDYIRKPFGVQAVQVTPLNIEALAKECGGEIFHDGQKEGHLSRTYIKVEVKNPIHENQSRAFYGDYLTKQGRTYKVYTEKQFSQTFESKYKSDEDKPAAPKPQSRNQKRRNQQRNRGKQNKPGNSPASMPQKRTEPIKVETVDQTHPFGRLTNVVGGILPEDDNEYKAFRDDVLAGRIKVDDHISELMNDRDNELLTKVAEVMPASVPQSQAPYAGERTEHPIEATQPEAAAVRRSDPPVVPAEGSTIAGVPVGITKEQVEAEDQAHAEAQVAEIHEQIEEPVGKPITLDELNAMEGDRRSAQEIMAEGK